MNLFYNYPVFGFSVANWLARILRYECVEEFYLPFNRRSSEYIPTSPDYVGEISISLMFKETYWKLTGNFK